MDDNSRWMDDEAKAYRRAFVERYGEDLVSRAGPLDGVPWLPAQIADLYA